MPPLPQDVTSATLVAKQPIFDLRGLVWGYELLFRDSFGLGDTCARSATARVMLDGFSLLRPILRGKQRFFINFSEDFLESGLADMLPPEVCGIEILESVRPTASILQKLAKLKQQGYILSLDDYIGQEYSHPFLPLVDIVKMDVLDLSAMRITELIHNLMPSKVRLLAEKVEDRETAEFCRKQGFSLFQGYFYSKPTTVRGIKFNPAQLTKTRLFATLSKKNVNFKRTADVLSSDAALMYKLLSYINSVYFGLPIKVHKVDHALRMLGTQKLRQWLFVVALAEFGTSPMAQEVVYISAQRAKFLETLAHASHKKDSALSQKLFLVGLFSLLNTLVQAPVEKIFAQLPLESDVLELLTGGHNRLSPWYDIMVAYEQARWDEVQFLTKPLRITDQQLLDAYTVAGRWVNMVFQTPPPQEKISNV